MYIKKSTHYSSTNNFSNTKNTIKNIRVCLVTVFSPYFLFLRTIFYIWDYKTCLATQNEQKTKTILQTQFMKETENMQNTVFNF